MATDPESGRPVARRRLVDQVAANALLTAQPSASSIGSPSRARAPAGLHRIADAQRNLVVRDGWASFFYHTYDSISYLEQTVTGLKSLGYTFVAPTAA